MRKIQRNNLISLLMIIKKSKQKNSFFLQNIDAVSECEKLANFLEAC